MIFKTLSSWTHYSSSQLFTQLKQLWNESLKKIQAWTGFKPMTSVILLHCSTNWAIKPSRSWSCNLLVRNIPVEGEECKWIYEISYNQTVEKDMKTWLIITVIWYFLYYSFASLTSYRYITNKQHDQLPDGLKAQLVPLILIFWVGLQIQISIHVKVIENITANFEFTIDHRSYSPNLSSCEIKNSFYMVYKVVLNVY